MNNYILILFLLITLNSASISFADQVYLTNGDRITGKIIKMENGKLSLKSEILNEVIIDSENIDSFTTEQPIELHFSGSLVIEEKIEKSESGKISVKSLDSKEQKVYELSEIVRIGPLPDPVVWTTSLSTNITGSEGNSENFNFNFGAFVKRRSVKDRITFGGEYFFEEDGDETTQDEWYTDLQYDYFFSKKFFWFTSVRFEQDDLSDLDFRFILSPGVGYQWVERDDLNFSTEAGLAYIHESFSEGESNNELTLRLGYHFDKNLFSKLKFFHDLKLFPAFSDPSDIYLITSAGLRTQITENFFTEAKMSVEHDTSPADDAEETDLHYTIGVGVSF